MMDVLSWICDILLVLFAYVVLRHEIYEQLFGHSMPMIFASEIVGDTTFSTSYLTVFYDTTFSTSYLTVFYSSSQV